MKTVTFYSYKGGVGRTLALANVAVDIALLGESLFLIDFDLEAPGLQTFEFLSGNIPSLDRELKEVGKSDELEIPGLSDLVLDYMQRPEDGLPDLTQYVISSNQLAELSKKPRRRPRAYKSEEPGSIWFLPAGTRMAFEQINWQDLYDNFDGYLFFEALKGEIEDKYGVDWLFIDSRTGRAETSGICTRQLADTNVLVFFPNNQNLVGFQEIYDMFVDEPSRADAEKDPIDFVYLASRIPTSDDEEDILSDQLQKFASVFDLSSEEKIIQLPHNNSLNLLSQDLFSVVRPRSKLAKGYFTLADQLLEQNEASLLGARRFFDRGIVRKYLDAYYNYNSGIEETEGSKKAASELTAIFNRAEDNAMRFPADPRLNAFLSAFFGMVANASYASRRLPQDAADRPNRQLRASRQHVFHRFILIGEEETAENIRINHVTHLSTYLLTAIKQGEKSFLDALEANELLHQAYPEPSYLQKGFIDTEVGKDFVSNLVSAANATADGYNFAEDSEEDDTVVENITGLLNWYAVSDNLEALKDLSGKRGLIDWSKKKGQSMYLFNRIEELIANDLSIEVQGCLTELMTTLLRSDSEPEYFDAPEFHSGKPPLDEPVAMKFESLSEQKLTDQVDTEVIDQDIYRLVRLGRFDEASLAIAKMMEHEGESLANKFNLAIISFLQGSSGFEKKLNALISEFVKSERENLRGDANFYQCYGVVLWVSGKRKEATEKFRKAVNKSESEQTDIFSCFDYREIPKIKFVEQCFRAANTENLRDLFNI